jgi:hypothetical protein
LFQAKERNKTVAPPYLCGSNIFHQWQCELKVDIEFRIREEILVKNFTQERRGRSFERCNNRVLLVEVSEAERNPAMVNMPPFRPIPQKVRGGVNIISNHTQVNFSACARGSSNKSKRILGSPREQAVVSTLCKCYIHDQMRTSFIQFSVKVRHP